MGNSEESKSCRRFLLTGALFFFATVSLLAQEVTSDHLRDSLTYDEAYWAAIIAMEDSIHQTLQLEDFEVVSHTQILGSKFKARNRTGSAYYLAPQELRRMGFVDINRMLGSVPGVNIYEEDGFGLRPNISLRGTKAERSERVSIMEDGVLAAPAPYSAPAAYYFPNAGRMHAIEVLKGSSQIQYGPFTTGGAINMVSTPIPESFEAELRASYGMYNSLRGYGKLGNKHRHFGYMVEYMRYQSDGFKRYTSGIPVKGFRRNDVIAKAMWDFAPGGFLRNMIELKVGYADEVSDETYLGLSEEDFWKTPFIRYPGSEKDEMRTRHQQYVLTHVWEPSSSFTVTSHLYHNHFHRNWYKLNDVRAGLGESEVHSIGDVLLFPETLAPYFGIMKGERDYKGESLMVRANDRTYNSTGIQTKVEHRFRVGQTYFTSELGLRYHTDSEARYQRDDGYSMVDGVMSLYYAAEPGSQSNRITSAKAFAGYYQAKAQWAKWTLNAGVRYENVQLLKKDYGKEDPTRTGQTRVEVPNSAAAFIPSVGVSFQPISEVTLFSGVHRGFAPPSAELFQEPENSTNMEVGARLNVGELHAEVIGFFNAFTNMLGSDLTAAGGQGTLEQFNVGAADVYGVELLLQWQPFPRSWKVRLPIQAQYTFTNTEMKNQFVSPAWGMVQPGDEIPYIYKHSASGTIGVEYGKLDLNISARYKGDMRSEPGQGVMPMHSKIPAHLVWDASAHFRVNKRLTICANAVNITNLVYLSSRHPAGLRPGHPFAIYGGFSYRISK